MGYYKEALQKFEATGLRVWEVLCAMEVEMRDFTTTDEQFENVVAFVYDWVMHADILPSELLSYIATGLANEDFTIEDFGNFEGEIKITEALNNLI